MVTRGRRRYALDRQGENPGTALTNDHGNGDRAGLHSFLSRAAVPPTHPALKELDEADERNPRR